jgi:hypothetical protein
MTRVRSSSTPITPGSFMYLDGLIIINERFHKIHENLNNIPRLRDIWLPIDPPLLRGCAKFFKLEDYNEFREGDRIVKMEFSRVVACFQSWKLCKSGDVILSWVYAGANEISFSHRIKSN